MNAPMSMSLVEKYAAVPQGLKARNQWLCWRGELRGEKPTKVPYHPVKGTKASVTNPSTWASFDVAVAMAHRFDGIGFVFTKSDPFVFVDGDNKANDPTIAEELTQTIQYFDSYAEWSPSGTGCHIIVEGVTPEPGRRAGQYEIYSANRFATFTGNCIRRPGEIMPRQEQLDKLWAHLVSLQANNGSGAPTGYQMDAATIAYIREHSRMPTTESDESIIAKATDAANGEKFERLWRGDMSDYGNDHSRADLALMNILQFYTPNAEQAIRLFHRSALGQRDKAYRRDYIQRTLLKTFDRTLPPPQIDGDAATWEAFQAQRAAIDAAAPPTAPIEPEPALAHAVAPTEPALAPVGGHASDAAPVAAGAPVSVSDPCSFADGSNPFASPPPGLLGDIASFVYAQSPRQIAETALIASLGLLAGIVGRNFQVNGDGLNLYLLMLAETGTGKDAINSGIHKLIGALKRDCPSIANVIGPATISSAQALNTHLQSQSCFVSIIGEFGLFLSRLAGPKPSVNDEALQRALLAVYGLSGRGKVWGSTIYADKAKNMFDVASPSVTILGEGTPASFFDALNPKIVEHGLISRFLIVEYIGRRPYLNEESGNATPSPHVLERLNALYRYACDLQTPSTGSGPTFCDIAHSGEAKELSRRFSRAIDDYHAVCDNPIERVLWTRVHAQVCKLAGIVAVSRYAGQAGCDYSAHRWWDYAGVPNIETQDFQWAINFVVRSVQRLVAQFKSGEVGENGYEVQQITQVCRVIKHYLGKSPNEVPPEARALRERNFISYRTIQHSCVSTKAFNEERRTDRATALKRALGELEKIGCLKRNDFPNDGGTSKGNGQLYEILDVDFFRRVPSNKTKA
jgi:hypothetical protein